MKASLGSIVGVALLTLATAGCGREGASGKPGPRKVVARVNNRKLLWRDMEKRAENFLRDDVNVKGLVIPEGKREEALDFFRRRAVKVFVFKTLFLAEARRLDIRVNEEDRKQGLEKLERVLQGRNLTPDAFFAQSPLGEKAMRAEFEDGLMIDKLLEQVVRSQIKVEDKDMDEVASEISRIHAERRKKIEGIRKELLAGANFVDVARKSSECPSGRDGGDLGDFERNKNRLGQEIDNAAFTQPVGVIGETIRTRQGFHIVKVTSRSKARAATATTPAVPETARVSHILIKAPTMTGREIQNEVLRRKYAKGVEDYYRHLREKARVESLFTDLVL